MPLVYDYLRGIVASGRPVVAALVDPDTEHPLLDTWVDHCEQAGIGFYLVGGSLLYKGDTALTVQRLKSLTRLPVVLFPASPSHLCGGADALLFLSLISGRNPDFLIGRHVEAAPLLKKLGLEVIPTGYMLVDCGAPTTAHYVSGTSPLPYDKPEIAACVALAGSYLGLKALYLDGGSGAPQPVDPSIIEAVKRESSLPLFVGGGLRTPAQCAAAARAGADVLVVGHMLEKSPHMLEELCRAVSGK